MGSSKTPKSTTSTSKHELTPQAQEFWELAKPTVKGIFDRPYQPYTGNRVTGLNGLQHNAANLAFSKPGMPMDAASSRSFLNKTLAGNGVGIPVPQNPFIGKSVRSNPMLEANNPYFEGSLKNTLNDVTDQFQRNRIAQTDANFARHNLFGGSNWADAQRGNQRELAKTLGDISTNSRFQEYNNRAQLHEADIGRRLQEQTRDAGLAQHRIDMANQNAHQNQKQQMQAATLLPNIARMETEDTANRYNLQASAGQLQQQQEQAGLDDAYQRFSEQQDYDKQRSDYLREWLSAINGNGVTSVTKPGAAGTSPFAKVAGSGMAGLGTYAALAATPLAPYAIPAGLLAGGMGMFS